MNLDLQQIFADWPCDPEAVCARMIRARGGEPLIQLRVDLGVIQMSIEGRPDGRRYRGLPGVLEHILRDQRLGRPASEEDWRELNRELQQYNYRRLAISSLADAAFDEDDAALARQHLQGALRDIQRCLETLELLRRNRERCDTAHLHLAPILVFNRARLRSRLHAALRDFDAAVEEAESGAAELEQTLLRYGFEADVEEVDPGIAYLRQMGRRLRQTHGIGQTLREQLEDAIDREDFEAAAALRDALRRRVQLAQRPRLPAPDEPATGL